MTDGASCSNTNEIKEMNMPLFRKVDAYLLALLFFPLVGYLLFTKWAVVYNLDTTELSGLVLFEFLRLHIAYYLLFFVWSVLMLTNSKRWHITMRTLAIAMLLYFALAELGYSAAIQVTGVVAPYDVAYYTATALGNASLSIPVTTFVTLVFIPVAFLLLPVIKHFVGGSLNNRITLLRKKAAIVAGVCLVVASYGPVPVNAELGHVQPSYMYQIDKFFEKTTQKVLPVAGEPKEKASVEVAPLTDQRPNLVMIGLESVRATATGIYNPERKAVTPFLNRMAEQSIVYERAYTVVPHTSKALAAVNCGWAPFFRHPIYESHLGTPSDCLAKVLGDLGYATVFFQSPTEHFENRRGLVNQFGFQEFYAAEQLPSEGFELVNYFGYEDNIMLRPSMEWLEKQDSPFFAFYLTGTTHHPYWAPESFGFTDFSNGEPIHEKEASYLNALHYLDTFMEKLIAQYKALGLYENTIFVVFGDHGESIGTHGRHQHNPSLYEETLRIPLIVHGAHINPVRVTTTVVSQVDIMPTVLSLLGYELETDLPGRVITDNSPDNRAPVFAACWYDDWCAARVDSQYKYIYNFNEKPEELYDLVNDPGETRNLASEYPELVARFRTETKLYYSQNLEHYDRYYVGLEPQYLKMKPQTVSKEMQLFTKKDKQKQSASRVAMNENEHSH